MRGRRQRLTWALSSTVAALLTTGLLSPASAADPVQITLARPAEMTFPHIDSPGPDLYDERIYLGATLSRASNITVEARNASGTLVRTLATNVSTASGWSGSWDFRTSGGTAVPDGDYTVRFTAIDPDGNVAAKDVATPIDRSTEVPLQGITPGSTISGPTTVSVTSPPGVHLTKARFFIGSTIGAGTCARTAEIAADGAGTVTGSLLPDDCGAYSGNAWAALTYTDRFGTSQTGWTPYTPVSTADHTAPVIGNFHDGNHYLYLKTPDSYDATGLSWVVREPAGIASATYRVTTALGLPVASGPMVINPPTEGNASVLAEWRGTDAGGSLVAGGTYRLSAHIVDRAGNASDSSPMDVVVDATVPGTLTLERLASNKWAAHVRVADGINPNPVQLVEGDERTIVPLYLQASGTYDGTITMPNAGQYTLRARITRPTQGFPANRVFTTALQTVDATLPEDTDPPTVGPAPSRTLYFIDPDTYADETLDFDAHDASAVTAAPYEFRNGAGEVVHTQAPTSFVDLVTWGGTHTGARLPAGTYTVSTTFTDAGGRSTPATGTFTLESQTPATLTVVEDASHPGLLHATVTAAPGVDISAARIRAVPTADGSSVVVTAHRDTATGRWVADVDLSGRSGTYTIEAQVERPTPASFSTTGWYTTGSVTATVTDDGAPVVVAPAGVTEYLLDPTRYGLVPLTYRVTDDSDVTGTFEVANATGTVVRSAQPVSRSFPAVENMTVAWDGTNDSGAPLPSGRYTIRTLFTDASGNTTPGAPVTVVLDAVLPGELTTPAAGTVMMGTAPVEFAPTAAARVSLSMVEVCMDGDHPCDHHVFLQNPSPDGLWRTTWPVGAISAGEHHLRFRATWKDPSGTSHEFTSADRTVVVDPVTIPVEIETTPAGPLGAMLSVDASSPRSEDLDVAVDWGDGTPAEQHTMSAPYATSGYRHTYSHSGTYTPRVTVSGDEQSSSATSSVTVITPPAAPGNPTATSGNQTIRLAWTAPGGPVSSYTVAWTGDGTTWRERSVLATARSTTLSGLTNGRLYAVHVRAVNAAGPGAWSSVVYRIPNAVPPPIAAIRGEARSRAALISWTPGTVTASYGKPAGFAIQRYRSSDHTWVTVRWVGASTRSALVGDLVPRRAYLFRVRASNEVGLGRPSSSVRVVPRR